MRRKSSFQAGWAANSLSGTRSKTAFTYAPCSARLHSAPTVTRSRDLSNTCTAFPFQLFTSRHNKRTELLASPNRCHQQSARTCSIIPMHTTPRFHEEVVAKTDEGRQLELAGDLESALEKYDEAIELERNDPLGWSSKGHLLFKMKQYEAAIKCYQQVIRCKPQSPEAFVDMALCHVHLEDANTASIILADAIFLDPKLISAYGYRGDIRFANGEMEQAFEDYSMVISLEGKNVTAWLGIGKVELKRGRLLNARTAFGYALQYAEANYNAIKHTKEAVLKQDDDFGRLENALLHLLDAHSMQGVLDQQENKLEEALGWFTRGLRLVFGEDADKPSKIDTSKVGNLYTVIADLFMKRAYVHLLEYDHRKCVQDCDQALFVNPDNHVIRFVRGQAYFALDAYREAHNDLTLYLTIEKKKGTHTDDAQGHLAALQKIVDVCQTRMRV